MSGNLDEPEGGLDAILQAIVCKEDIGWRDSARRLLVFSTDAGFHSAGDGRLGGIVQPNDGQCHLDPSGVYTEYVRQDYPSISQINNKVKENAINIIFAVTEGQMELYNLLAGSIEGSSAGTLSDDSSNVVQLVEAQYEAITSELVVKDNSSHHLRVTYFSACLTDGPMRETNRCSGLRVGTRVRFLAKVELLSCPEDPAEWRQTVEIYPVGINEAVVVDLEMLCGCGCEVAGHAGYEAGSADCSGRGTLACGVCDCHRNSFGDRCECDLDDLGQARHLEAGCRPENATTGPLCSGRGQCQCGRCECDARSADDEVFSGRFCECDNFSCDRRDGLVCSGHGECRCDGTCRCDPAWSSPGRPACDCYALDDTCRTPHGEHVGLVCSGRGDCVCGECRCRRNETFLGDHCETCETCPDKCGDLAACVQCLQFSSGPLLVGGGEGGRCGLCQLRHLGPGSAVPDNTATLLPVDRIDEEDVDDVIENIECQAPDDDGCFFYFMYRHHRETGALQVQVQRTKNCPPPPDVLLIVLWLVGVIVGVGLVVILMWKAVTTVHDRREFARFEKERLRAKWDAGQNPIFKQATSTFKNPTYSGR